MLRSNVRTSRYIFFKKNSMNYETKFAWRSNLLVWDASWEKETDKELEGESTSKRRTKLSHTHAKNSTLVLSAGSNTIQIQRTNTNYIRVKRTHFSSWFDMCEAFVLRQFSRDRIVCVVFFCFINIRHHFIFNVSLLIVNLIMTRTIRCF